jgi:hypothetical protein
METCVGLGLFRQLLCFGRLEGDWAKVVGILEITNADASYWRTFLRKPRAQKKKEKVEGGGSCVAFLPLSESQVARELVIELIVSVCDCAVVSVLW